MGELAEKGDCYDPLPCAADHEMLTDAEQYSVVWGEAVKLRASGQLLRSFVALDCPITLIQGEQDPHPVCGVCGPLAGSGKDTVQPAFLPRIGGGVSKYRRRAKLPSVRLPTQKRRGSICMNRVAGSAATAADAREK